MCVEWGVYLISTTLKMGCFLKRSPSFETLRVFVMVLIGVIGVPLVTVITQQCVKWRVNSTGKFTRYGCLQMLIFKYFNLF